MSVRNMNQKQKGFTIVELVVVIIVIGILAAIVIVGYGAWRTNVAKSNVQSDLNSVKAAMESARNFNQGGYPSSIPSSFTSSPDVTVTYARGSSVGYCVEARSISVISVVWFLEVNNGTTTIAAGNCTDGTLFANAPTGVASWRQADAYDGSATSSNASYGIKSDGSLWAWGFNDNGQIGNNSTSWAPAPVQVISGNVSSVTSTNSTTFAIKSDGSLWGWGNNASGQVGNGSTTTQKTPLQIIASGVQKVIQPISTNTTYILKTDGTLWGMGA